MGTPSTCFQFAPHSATFAIDDAGPGYRWLELHADGSLESRVGRASGFALNIDLKDRGPR
jgi:Icc protein